ncbi:MORC family CW-type zinc finger protein 3a isoform X1 [Echeneis naucrates]|nr:MORC family CW-type zinc finger protein 3 isoform X1 [Echeneis naucrates]
MAEQLTQSGVPLSTLCPKFLHTNSTSHVGPFSAIAELIDNAFDPDVRAKQFWIDKTCIKNEQCLSFMDNGNGLNCGAMHKMLSFGYSEKTAVNGQAPIGIYGNGFKSGSMRLGKDAIVFSKSRSTSCVGMLSQTYLEKIQAKQIIVPIVCFEHTNAGVLSVKEEYKPSLEAILHHSPFKTQENLLSELDVINPPVSPDSTGTRIIIWNLRKTSSNTLEFDFEKDRYDIRIPSDVYEAKTDTGHKVIPCIPEIVYSLRAYCSILYLRPRMQIMIRGQKVKSELIDKSLASRKTDYYKPNFCPRRIPIKFGYNTKSKDQYGIMMYHKNRLIKGYERVGCQLKANNQGVGVIGIIECDFLEPTHNKQSFNDTDKYRKTIANVGSKLEDYWKEIRYRWNKDNPNSTIAVEDIMKRPDQNWVQCDECLKWRKLPDGIDYRKLPDKWSCNSNPDPEFRSCNVPEEAEDSDDEQTSYSKTYKQQEREEKKKKREKEEEDRRHQEELLANHARQKKNNKKQVRRKCDFVGYKETVNSPTTPRSRINTESLQGGAERAESSLMRSSTISQAAFSPASNSGLPVVTDVFSLSTDIMRGKRTQQTFLQITPKRPRLNDSTSSSPLSLDVRPLCSPSAPAEDDDDDDDTDDDIVILENASTPKPKKPCVDVTKVKIEQELSDSDIGQPRECNDDVAVDADASTSLSSAPPPELMSTTTQTEVPKVKEEESQNQTESTRGAEQNTSNEKSSHMDIEQSVTKQEEDTQTHIAEKQTLQNGLTHHKNDQALRPTSADMRDRQFCPHHPCSDTAAQEQLDQLLHLKQLTAQERDSYKEQVHELTCKLQDMQRRLQEMSEMNVKKECSPNAIQTEEAEETEGEDYKSLYEKAKKKVDELINDKEALLAAAKTKNNNGQNEEKDIDDLTMQIDCLDQINQENKDLQSEVDRLTRERANLAAQCEQLRLNLQQQKEDAQERSTTAQRATASSAQIAGEESARTSVSVSETFKSLIALRQNVSRLLVTYIPALDLGQVNYECNVIDEILEQVISDVDSFKAIGQRCET